MSYISMETQTGKTAKFEKGSIDGRGLLIRLPNAMVFIDSIDLDALKAFLKQIEK